MRKWDSVALIVVGAVILGVLIMSGSRTPITKEGFGNLPVVIEFDSVGTTISNNAAEATLYEVEIPRSSLGLTERCVKVEIEFIGRNNSGGAKTITWRVYYGTSAALTLPVDTWADSADYFAGTFVVYLINGGAVNDQDIYARDVHDPLLYNTDSWAQNSNKDLNLKITTDFSAAHASLLIINKVTTTLLMIP